MSNYLTYNNRMILHPTDGMKYFYGIVEDPPQPQDEVQIGSQIWKSRNLAIDDGLGGITTQTVNYGQGDVTEYYYTWDAAVRVAATVSGWHLPTAAEWDTLAIAVGGASTAGTKLKSTYGWEDDGNGTDDYGFSAFPAGYMYWGSFLKLGRYTYFWTATENMSSYAYIRYFDTGASMYSDSSNKQPVGCSVRLVKD